METQYVSTTQGDGQTSDAFSRHRSHLLPADQKRSETEGGKSWVDKDFLAIRREFDAYHEEPETLISKVTSQRNVSGFLRPRKEDNDSTDQLKCIDLRCSKQDWRFGATRN